MVDRRRSSRSHNTKPCRGGLGLAGSGDGDVRREEQLVDRFHLVNGLFARPRVGRRFRSLRELRRSLAAILLGANRRCDEMFFWTPCFETTTIASRLHLRSWP